MTQKTLSIDDFDIRTPSTKGQEIEIQRADGTGTGVFIMVLGEQSPVVEQYLVRKADERAAAIMKARQNKKPALSAQDTLDDEIESAVVRTAGWRGLAEECTEANAGKLYRLNRSIARQVIAASADETLFTKA